MWVGAFVVFASSLALLFNVPTLIELTRASRSGVGVIVSTEPNEHMSVTAQFQRDGNSYRRKVAGYGYHVGDAVRVFYDINNPSFFVIEEPRLLLARQLRFSFVASAILSTIFTVCFILWWRHHRIQVPSGGKIVPPRVTLSIIVLAVLAGWVLHAFVNIPNGRAFISGALVLSGCLILLIRAWKLPLEAGWTAYVRSRVFGLGAALAIIGNIIGLVDKK